jgi:hypothetical protein
MGKDPNGADGARLEGTHMKQLGAKRFLARMGLVTALAVTAGTAGTAVQASADTASASALASITLVHGIPDLPVDIYVNGGAPVEDVVFTTVATVPGRKGMNMVEIRPANAPSGSDPVLARSFFLRENQSKSVVAHLSGSGNPKITVFANDQSPLPAGTARLTVRHTAAAPAVDIVADNSLTVFAGLRNPRQGKADVPAATYLVDVRAAGTSTAVLDDAPVDLDAGTNTVVYAIGDLAGGMFTVAVQVLPVRPF